MKRQRFKIQLKRSGVTTLEYVMVLGFVFPAAFLMLQLMVRAFTAIHEFMTATVGWAIL